MRRPRTAGSSEAKRRVSSIASSTTKSGQQVVADEQGAAMNLLAELVEGDAQRVADKIVDILAVEVEPAIVARKQRFGQPVEDVFQGLAGRGAPCLAVAADAVGFLARYPQLGNDAIELPSLERRAVLAGRDDFSSGGISRFMHHRTWARGMLTSASRSRSVS